MADPPPPAYDDVVAGTWQQDNNVLQNTTPYPSYPMASYSAPPVNAGFDNSSLRLSQQSLPENTNGALTTEAPPSYNATMSQDPSTIPVDNFARQSSVRRSSVVSVNVDQLATVVNNTDTTDADNDDGTIWGAIIMFGVGAAIPIAMIYVGVQNLDNCSDTNIPLYSVISGGLALAAVLLICLMICFPEGSFCFSCNAGLAVLLLIAHFGVQCWGSVIVFRKWELWKYKNFDCDKSTYLLSFSTLIIYWVLGLCGCKAAKGSD